MSTWIRVTLVALVTLSGVLPAATLSAQSTRHDVTGSVADSLGVPVDGAMVVALTSTDSVIAAFSRTGANGAFTLRRLSAGAYVLQVTVIGYQPVRREFVIADADVKVGMLTMRARETVIETLQVRAERVPIRNNSDTLEFDAAAFATRPNATVEDLLRRLPGVQVEKDGSVTAQGETVTTVTVDGKEFFGRDPKVATKNLPANAIKTVQVYDRRSDLAEFTGVPDGNEQKAINLVLRDDARHSYFGRSVNGLGGDLGKRLLVDAPDTDEARYSGSASLNRFTPTTQLAGIANVNNINQPGFSWGDYQTFIGGAKGMAAEGGAGASGGGTPDDGFTQTAALGLNASHNYGTKSWIRSSYFLSDVANRLDQSLQQQLLFGEGQSAFKAQNGNQDTDTRTHTLNVNLQHTFADGHDMRFRTQLAASNSFLGSSNRQSTVDDLGILQNAAATSVAVDGSDQVADASLTWRKRLGASGRSLIGEVKGNIGSPELNSDLASTIALATRVGADTSDILQEQLRDGRTLTHSQRLSLTEPLRGQMLLELFAQRSATDEDQTRAVYDVTDGTRLYNAPLSASFDRTYTYLGGGGSLARNTSTSKVMVGVRYQNTELFGQVAGSLAPVNSRFHQVLPSANYYVQLAPGRNINLSYRTATKVPSMVQLQPILDNTNPLNVFVGNPDLGLGFTHSGRAEYRYFDQFSFVNFFVFGNLSHTRNDIVLSRSIDASGAQTVTSVNANGGWATSVGATYGMPIRPLGAKIDVSYNLGHNTGIEFLNGNENLSRVLTHSSDIALENRAKDLMDVRLGVKLGQTSVRYSLNPSLNQRYTNTTVDASGSFFIGETWTLNSTLEYRLFDEQLVGPDGNVALLGALVAKLYMDGRAELQLAGIDLLNQNQGIRVISTANLIQSQRVQSLGRHVMMRFVYRLGPGGK